MPQAIQPARNTHVQEQIDRLHSIGSSQSELLQRLEARLESVLSSALPAPPTGAKAGDLVLVTHAQTLADIGSGFNGINRRIESILDRLEL